MFVGYIVCMKITFILKTTHSVTKEFLNLETIFSNLIYASQNYTHINYNIILILSSLLTPYVKQLMEKELFKKLRSLKKKITCLQLYCDQTLKC
jgi:hypothetical protein